MSVPYFDADGDNSKQAVRTQGCHLKYIHVHNSNAVDAWIQLFDALGASVTVGSTTPTQSYFIPAMGAFETSFDGAGMAFETGLLYACTTTATGATDPTTGLTVNMAVE